MKNFILVVSSIAITYIVFESVFVLVGSSPYQHGRVAEFQWIGQNPLRGWVNRSNFKHGDTFSTDARGLRNVELASNGSETIVCMGDSGTFGTWDDGTWPRFPDYPGELQKRLNPEQFKVVNAGVIGYTSSHLLRQYMLQIRKMHPSRIVIRVGFNDHSPAWDVRLAVREPTEFWKQLLLYKMSSTFTVQTAVTLRLAFKAPRAGLEPWNDIDQFRFHLEALITNARKDGVQVILLDYPIRPAGFPKRDDGKPFPEKIWGVKNHEELIRLHSQYNREIKLTSERMRVPLVQTGHLLEDIGRAGFTSTDIVHPGPEGYRLIAEELSAFIKANPLNVQSGSRP
ncbi:MAG: SGNH/GDSL hydrolase family protein [Spirochaetia bacterium]|nr:SGNH/GDSL hydrolase family protein [Spirochaetia bacterium]